MEKKLNIKRFDYIDLIKMIAIIMVIILHSGLLSTNFIKNNTISSTIQYAIRIVSEGVPLFVMANGFLLLHKEKFDLKKHLKKIIKIFILLITWSVICFVLKCLILQEKLSFMLILKNVLTTDINNTYTGYLWFLQNLIMLYLIYPILKYLYDNNKSIYNYLFIIVFISTVGINFINIISQCVIKMTNFDQLNMFVNYIKKFNIISNGYFLLFFMFGGYLYEKKEQFENKKKCVKFICIGGIAWGISFVYAYVMSKINNKLYSGSFNYNTIFMLFIMIGIFAISNLYKDNGHIYNKVVTCIGKNSLGIYLIHSIIIILLDGIIPILNTKMIFRIIIQRH